MTGHAEGNHHDGVDPTLERYLARVDASLMGPRSWRADVVAELRDGLELAADEHRAAGVEPDLAVRLAVADFGDPTAVAAGFAGEAGARRAHRVAGLLLATGPVVAGVWVAALVTTGAPMMRGELAGSWRWMPLIGAVLAVAIPAALLGFTAAGPGALRYSRRPRLAPTAAATSAAMCAAGDLLMLAMFGAWLVDASPLTSTGYVVGGLAAAVSGTRLVAATLAARRCAATRVRMTFAA